MQALLLHLYITVFNVIAIKRKLFHIKISENNLVIELIVCFIVCMKLYFLLPIYVLLLIFIFILFV